MPSFLNLIGSDAASDELICSIIDEITSEEINEVIDVIVATKEIIEVINVIIATIMILDTSHGKYI